MATAYILHEEQGLKRYCINNNVRQVTISVIAVLDVPDL
jgi:hypothetical protein